MILVALAGHVVRSTAWFTLHPTRLSGLLLHNRCEQYAEALQRCVTKGLTAVHTNDENAVEVYARLQEEGRLPVRVYLTMPHDELDKEQPAAGKSGGGGDAGKPKPWSGDEGLLSWNRVKLFSDGSLGACAVSAQLRECPTYVQHENRAQMSMRRLKT